MSFSLAVSDEIENMVQGGDFENDLDMNKWTLNNWQSAGTMEIDDSTAATGEACLFVDITQSSGWDPRPYQDGFQVKEGKTYTLSMFLMTDEPVALLPRVHISGPWTLFMEKRVTIGPEWEEYWVTGSPAQDMTVQISVCDTGVVAHYWLDNVKFYEGEYVPTDTGESDQQVAALGKLSTTWAGIKARR